MPESPPGSAEQPLWVQKGHVGVSSLSAAAPGPPRPYPTPPARAQRVPGVRRLPAGGATSRASPAPLATLRLVLRCLRSSPGEPPPSRHGSRHCGSDSAERSPRCGGLGRGRRLRPLAPPGLGGRLRRGRAPAPWARAESASGGAASESRSARGTRAGAGRVGTGVGSGVLWTPRLPWAARLRPVGARGLELAAGVGQE